MTTWPQHFPFSLEPADFGTPSRLYERDPACPLRKITLPSGDGAYFAPDRDDVERVLRDRRFSRDFRYPGAPRLVADDDMSANPDAIVNVDPPEHTRLRRIIQKAFRPALAVQWRPIVERITGQLLDGLEEAGPPADLVLSFARLLPIRTMCELLDVPATDIDALTSWTGVFFDTSERTHTERAEAGAALASYIGTLVASRRERPGNGLIDDLIADCDTRGLMSDGELHQMIGALFIGGQENTAATLARGLVALLRHPGQWQALVTDPGLAAGAVEEILRLEVPSEGAFLRVATEDVTLGSGVIPRGGAVQVSLPSANRSPRHFADPERFDIRRSPNPHLTFGAGAHFCVGAPLARLELLVALRAVTSRFPALHLTTAPHELLYTQGTLVRALLSLPVAW